MSGKLSDKARRDCLTVERAMAGEELAYTELYERYKDAVFFMLLKIVGNRADAEDLTSEAFGKTFGSLADYSPQFAFSTWLFKIALNHAVDFVRKRKLDTCSIDRHATEREAEGFCEMVSEDRTPVEEAIREERAACTRDVVASMKEDYRRLIELRYFEEYSYEEIARELGWPLGTVKTKLFRAKGVLFNLLKERGITYEN